MKYEVRFSPRAYHFLKKMKEAGLKKSFQTAFSDISENPYIGSQKRGDLAGIFGYDVYYNKTNYEIAYQIIEENDKRVVVLLVGSRENFYDELKRYLN